MLLKGFTLCQQICNTQQWSQHRKRSFLKFQSQRKAIPKNAETTAQLHSSHTLAKSCSKFSKPGFNSTWTLKFLMFKLDLEKTEEPEVKLPTPVGSLEKQESSRKPSTSDLLTMPKLLTVWNNTNWKILEEMGTSDHLTCLLRNLCAGQEAIVSVVAIRSGKQTHSEGQCR